MDAGTPIPTATLVFEALEPRLLLSGDPAPTAWLYEPHAGTPAEVRVLAERVVPSGTAIGAVTAARPSRELVLVDTATPDHRALLDDLLGQRSAHRQFEVVLIDAGRDGIRQVSDALGARTNLDAVHVVSHADDRAVRLGASTLDAAALHAHAAQIRAWGKALVAGGDLLFYGCSLAERADGKALMDALARLTGADVAASEDVTGDAAQGGDWTLEYATGAIEAEVAVSPGEQHAWRHTLATAAISRTPVPIAVDGAPEAAWSTAASNPIVSVVDHTSPVGGASDLSGSWRAMWDEDHLYLLVDVSDATLQTPDGSGGGASTEYAVFSDDVVEVFIDGNASRGTTYDRYDDFQWGFRWNPAAPAGSDLGKGEHGATPGGWAPVASMPGIAQRMVAAPGGYRLELALDWAMLKAIPAPGKTLGLEIHLADDDNGGGRDSKLAWTGIADTAWQNPATWGTVTLHAAVDPPVAGNDAYVVAEDGALAVGTTWWNAAWPYREVLSLRNASRSEDLVEFPVLVAVSSANFGPGIYAQVKAGGQDLRFVDRSGAVLAHEIDSWDATGTSYVWVKVPRIDAASDADVIWMYWGNAAAADAQNAAAVWSNGYVGVWHLDDVPDALPGSREMLDSTGFAAHGTSIGLNGADVQAGHVGRGAYFGNAAGPAERYIEVTSHGSDALSLTATVTLEAWARRDGGTGGFMNAVARAYTGTAQDSYSIVLDVGDASDVRMFVDPASASGGTGAVADDTWTYLTGTRSSAALSMYVDGALRGTTAAPGGIPSDPNSLVIGGEYNWGVVSEGFRGWLDEIRVSSVVRSAAWIDAQYASMRSSGPDQLIVYGAPEARPATLGVLANDSDASGDALAAALVAAPTKGALTLKADGTFTYTPNANVNGTDTFTYRAGDGATTSGIATVSITITPANDAPVLDAAPVLLLPAVNEDAAAPVGTVGTLISSLVDFNLPVTGRNNVTDVDASAVTGLALTAVDAAHGTWHYTTDSGASWRPVGTVSDTSALLLAADTGTRLYFRSAPDWNGTVANAIAFRAWDRTSGTAGTKVDTTQNGGTSAFSTVIDTAAISVSPVNDAPKRALATVALAAVSEDAAAPPGGTVAALFASAFSDAADAVAGGSTAHRLTGIAIVANAANAATQGRWQYSGDGGTTWANLPGVSTTAALALPTSALLRFVPAANSSGAPGALTVRLIDDSAGALVAPSTVSVATSGGATRYANAANAVTLNTAVIAVNDPPTLAATPRNPTFAEAAGVATQAPAVNVFSTAAASPVETGQSLIGLTFTVDGLLDGANERIVVDGRSIALGTGTSGATATNGMSYTVTRAGTTATVVLGRSPGLSAASLNALVNAISYQNTRTDNPSPGNRVFTLMRLQDSGGTANGGVDTARLAIASTVNVVAVNDPPTLAGASTLAYTENQVPVAIGTLLTLVDADHATLASGTVSITGNFARGQDVLALVTNPATMGNIAAVYDSAAGVLALASAGATATAAQWQAALRAVTYSNASDNPSTAARAVSYRVSDGAASSNAVTSTVNVAAVNDAPVNSVPSVQAVASGATLEFSAANGNRISVTDADTAGNVQVQLDATSGTLTVVLAGATTITGGSNGSASLTLRGTQADLNASLDGLVFTPAASSVGSGGALRLTSNDLGGSGAGGPRTDTDTVAILVSGLSLSGTLFDDVDADGMVSDAEGVLAAATVTLYRDNGDALIGAGDVLAASTTSDGSGRYAFHGLAAGTYYVVIDSRTLGSAYNAGFGQSDVWAEQTYGTRGAAQGAGFLASPGALYGGRNPDAADNAAALTSAEHVTRVSVAGTHAGGIDAGFSFNVVTNLRGGDSADDDPGHGRSVQGSLRQFLQNANAIAGANAMRFVPAVATDVAAGADAWWRLAVVTALPSLTDDDTTIDGTAYSNANGALVVNPNDAALGYAGRVGLGADLIANTQDDAWLPGLNGPELEIVASAVLPFGLDLQANGARVQDVAIRGFGGSATEASILVGAVSGTQIRGSLIGSAPGAFVDPGAGARGGNGIFLAGSTNAVIAGNVIGHLGRAGVRSNAASGLSLVGNELRSNGLDYIAFDGVDLHRSSNATVSGNRFSLNLGFGLDFSSGQGGLSIFDNTFTDNGIGGLEVGNLGLFGVDNTVTRNVIANAFGAGVIVAGDDGSPADASTQNLISRNSFFGNGGPAIDLVRAGQNNRLGDGITPNDGAIDAGTGNRGVDAPVIVSATLSGGSTTLVGTAATGVTSVEIYRAAPGAGDDLGGDCYGEGDRYLGAAAVMAGQWSITLAGLGSGDVVTALGTTAAHDTSEFGRNATVRSAPMNALPAPWVVAEDMPLALTGLSVADADDDVTHVVLTVGRGTLALAGQAGATVSGSGSAVVTILGTQTQINGTLSGGGLTFLGSADFNGVAVLSMTATDLAGLADVDTVGIAVTSVNDAPTANADAASVREDVMLTASGDVLANDTDVDASDTCTVTQVAGTAADVGAVVAGAYGSIVIAADGRYTYALDNAGSGVQSLRGGETVTDIFGYQMADGSGAAATTSLVVTISGTNDAPVLAGGNVLAYRESERATPIDAGLVVTDIDDGTLASAIVAFAGGLAAGEDELGFTNVAGRMGNIGGAYTAATGVLTLTSVGGTATLAEWQAALRAVTYANASTMPGTWARSIVFTVTDGTTTSKAVTSLVHVSALNGPPCLTVPTSYAAIERRPLALGGIGVGDDDGGTGLQTLSLTVVSGVLAALPGATGVAVTGSGTTSLMLVGSVAQLGALLAGHGGASLVYLAPASAPPVADTLTVTLDDGGNTGAGGPRSERATAAITITAVNDPPTVFVPEAQSVAEDTPLVLSAARGSAIAVADPDGAATLLQVTLATTNGVLTLADTTGLSFLAGDGTRDLAVTFRGSVGAVNAALDGLRFDPDPDYAAAGVINIRADDLGSGGTGGSLIALERVAVTVLPVNDAPVLRHAQLVLTAGVEHLLTLDDLSATDIDTAAAALRFEITGLVNGSFVLADAPDVAVIRFTQGDLLGGRVLFRPGFDGAPGFAVMVTDEATSDGPRAASILYAGVNVPRSDRGGEASAGGSAVAPAPEPLPMLTPPPPAAPLLAAPMLAAPMLAEPTAASYLRPPSAATKPAAAVEGRSTLTPASGSDLSKPVTLVANNDSYETASGRALTVLATAGLLANDAGLNGRAVIRVTQMPEGGTLSLDQSGGFVYAPRPGFRGIDGFSYEIRMADGRTASAAVRLLVAAEQQEVADLAENRGPGDGREENDRVDLMTLHAESRLVVPVLDGRNADQDRNEIEVVLNSIRVTGMALSVGAVWWAARAGGLLASLLVSAPAWRHLDPLPVLGRRDGRGREHVRWDEGEDADAKRDEDAVTTVLGDVGDARS